MSFLRDERKSTGARIGVVFFWVLFWVLGLGLLGPGFAKLLDLPGWDDNVFIALGGALGLCIGVYAALGRSRLAIALAFPAVLLGLFPF